MVRTRQILAMLFGGLAWAALIKLAFSQCLLFCPPKLLFYEIVFGIAFLTAVIAGEQRIKITLVVTTIACVIYNVRGFTGSWLLGKVFERSPGEVFENMLVGGFVAVVSLLLSLVAALMAGFISNLTSRKGTSSR